MGGREQAAKRMGKSEAEVLKKGARVEVNFDEPGFRGSWYTGTVIPPLKKKKKASSTSSSCASSKKKKKTKKKRMIWVEFDTLADDQQQRLKEQVDLICLRPVPPRETSRSFQLSDDVDAFHKDGWWEGVVTAVHPPASPPPGFTAAPATYSVFFRSTREQIRFPESDLRLHREWVHGEWVPPLPTPLPVRIHIA